MPNCMAVCLMNFLHNLRRDLLTLSLFTASAVPYARNLSELTRPDARHPLIADETH